MREAIMRRKHQDFSFLVDEQTPEGFSTAKPALSAAIALFMATKN